MNRRTWQIQLLFVLCSLVVLAAMGWITSLTIRLDRQDAEAQRRAEREENSRLALWRMDSALAPIVSQESVRPYFHFTAYFPVVGSYNASLGRIEDGEVFAPSPLVTFESPIVHLHFQINSQGEVSSPEAPDGPLRKALEDRLGSSIVRAELSRELRECSALVANHHLFRSAAEVCGEQFQFVTKSADGGAANGPSVVCSPLGNSWLAEEPPASKEAGRGRVQPLQQQLRNVTEFNQRQKAVDVNNKNSQLNNGYLAPQNLDPPSGRSVFAPVLAWGPVEATPFVWTWLDDELFYLRRVRYGSMDTVQGCWFDWGEIQRSLREEIQDLLPNAKLLPVADVARDVAVRPNGSAATYTLASMPIQLHPGELAAGDDRLSASIRNSLLIAWGCVVMAIVAVGALLRGSVALGERRADFVSAVTHELRTPLTTFRLYLDMLVSGRVREPEKRDEYLATLQSESERLGHLVENVLGYARLERGRQPACREAWVVGALVDRFADRLRRRAEQSEMQLRVDVAEDAVEQGIETDPTAVEQILYNLVDNAGKYASTADAPRIDLEVALRDGSVEFRVTDFGPGLTDEAKAKLFRPFSKSAHRAAHSAPGVGLGLALSRRLARDLGGDLLYQETQPSQGSRFVFRLPL